MPYITEMLRKLENANNPMKQFRKANGWTCHDMADRMGTYSQRYSKIELGLIKPTPKERDRISNIFGSDVLDWVMEQYNRKDHVND
jgi:transcriptional regulator with XRE-family HTH domain